MSGGSGAFNSIYLALDEERYEDAVQICKQKELSKLSLPRALLSFALVQLNRGDEGLAVASELLKLPTKDESVLSTLTHTFRALRDNASAIRCYELMLEMNPNSEKHAKELFFALAKAGEVRRMQKTASLLYKGMGKRRYLFWTVCCLLTAEPPTTMVYALADKMLTRLLFEVFPDSRPGCEELKLYLSVLLKQPQRRGDAMEALRQLSGRRAEPPLQDQDSEQSVPATALQLLELGQELMQAGGDWRGELDRLDGILAQYPDQWSALKRRADILCEHQIGHDDQALVLAHSQLQQAQTLYPGLRGPFLAELYVLSRVQGRQAAADLWGADAMVRAVCGYVDRFSAKPSCFSDLKPYIEGLRSDGRLAAIVTFLDTSIAAAGAQSASGSSAASLCRMSKLRQLRFLCDMESADLSACIELVRLYPVSEKPAAKGGDKDVTPGDELLLLAGTALRRLGRGGPEGCFARAVVADYGQCVSPHSFALKLELIDPLRGLGAASTLLTHFRGLGVRYIQLDTMTYLSSSACMELGLYKEALRQNRDVVAFSATALRDSMEMVVRGYQSGAYSSIFEMHGFAERCARSLQLKASKAEAALLALLLESTTYSESRQFIERLFAGSEAESDKSLFGTDEAGLEDAHSNMDYSLLVRFDVTDEENAAEVALRTSAFLTRVRLAAAVPQILQSLFCGDSARLESHLKQLIGAGAAEPNHGLLWDPSLRGACRGPIFEVVSTLGRVCIERSLDASGECISSLLALGGSDSILCCCDFTQSLLINADCIRAVSLLARAVLSWAPVALVHLSKHLKGEPTNVARDVAAALLALVRQMGVCLGKAEEAYATLDDSRIDLVSEGAYGEILQLPALQEARPRVLGAVIRDHQESLQRLRALLTAKAVLLGEAIE